MKRLFLLLTMGMMSFSLAQTAFLYVEPETTIAQPGDSFSINFEIADVESLYGWQIYLSWDPSVLHLKRVAEGPFLSENWTKTTFFLTSYDDTASGYMLFAAVLLGQVPSTSGSGTLGYGYFSVKQFGSSSLTLVLEGTWRTYLLDPDGNEIPFTKRDGFFTTGNPGIEEEIINTELTLGKFINPLTNLLEFDYFVPEPGFVRASLYDISGKVVKTIFKKSETEGWHKMKVPLSLPHGVYFLRLESVKGSLTKKIVVLN
jgi:hypothetical protein